jgi:hypothetical protein
MQETMLPITRKRLEEKPDTDINDAFRIWMNCKCQLLKLKKCERWILIAPFNPVKHFQPDLFTNTKAILTRHNTHVQSVIPSEKLLIFNVKQGWNPLVEFLTVCVRLCPFSLKYYLMWSYSVERNLTFPFHIWMTLKASGNYYFDIVMPLCKTND